LRSRLIDTGIHRRAGIADRLERTVKNIPMKRAGTAEEVSEAIVWLTTGAASNIGGSTLVIAGGL
jgi:NAD(P)-dependent dehydrogenase (short-subunit alcohol dehydrogenase family)